VSYDDFDGGPDYLSPMAKEDEIAARIREVRGAATQDAFGKRLGVSRGAVANWERGLGIKRENLQAIAERFRVSFEWLATGKGQSATKATETPNALVGDKLTERGEYIPLYGHAVGGLDGEFILNGNKLDEILAPPGLSPARGAYAVTCAGESMEPRYFDGETVFVDPVRRARRGDFVVAQIQNPNEGQPPLAYIKRFVRHNDNELILEQFNPPKELRFPHGTVVSVHFIVLGGRPT
jgi:phage repressor protein C with HTH and peptisase S24 domain